MALDPATGHPTALDQDIAYGRVLCYYVLSLRERVDPARTGVSWYVPSVGFCRFCFAFPWRAGLRW